MLLLSSTSPPILPPRPGIALALPVTQRANAVIIRSGGSLSRFDYSSAIRLLIVRQFAHSLSPALRGEGVSKWRAVGEKLGDSGS